MADTLPAGTAADPTAPGAGPTGGQPDVKALQAEITRLSGEVNRLTLDAQEWRSRHGGLQGKYQQEQEKWQGDATKITTLEATLQALRGEKEGLDVTLKSLTEAKTAAEQEAAKVRGRVERFELLAGEFPHLLQFEAKGLLPEGRGDELKTKLNTFSEQLKQLGVEALKNFQAGATPPPPTAPPANSPDALKAAAFKASREGNESEYNRLMDEYYQALPK